jgi:tetratricopeptide (TPR) repeat protein
MNNQKRRVLAVLAISALLNLNSPAWAADPDPIGDAQKEKQLREQFRGQQQQQQQRNDNEPKQKRKQSEQDFLDGFIRARALILDEKYREGIAALHGLGNDSMPDVANYIGYSYRMLGDYDDAKIWYEKALASDPNHIRTWQYYGMWQVERGNMLKAADHLEKLRQLCGTDCKEYADLKSAMEGHVRY